MLYTSGKVGKIDVCQEDCVKICIYVCVRVGGVEL